MSADKPIASACDEQSLLEYLDGCLPVHERLMVESHLERCQACRGNLAGFEKTLAMTSAVPEPAMGPLASSGFGAQVRRRIEEYGGWSWGRRWSPAFSGAIAGAAAVLLVLAASDRLSFVELPASAGPAAEPDVMEPSDSPGIEEFLDTVSLLYRDEVEVYGGEVLAESGSPDLDSEVSEYLLDTASEAELLEQMRLLADGEAFSL